MPRPEELRFTAGSATLAGTLLLPDPDADAVRHPFALLIGSWLPRDRDGDYDRAGHPDWFAARGPAEPPGLLARLAGALAARGVATLRWDKRGCAASRDEAAGLTWAATDLFTLIDDVRDALAALRGRTELDLRRTGLVAHGEGAVLALSVAIGDPAVGPLTLVGPPARSFRDVLRRAAAARSASGDGRQHALVSALDRLSEEIIERVDRGEATLDLRLPAEAGDAASVRLNLAGLRQAFNTPAVALATMLRRPVTLVHGEQDTWAHPDESRLLEDALTAGGSSVRRIDVPGAGHDLAQADEPLVAELAADLAGRLEPRELPPVLLAIEELNDPGPAAR